MNSVQSTRARPRRPERVRGVVRRARPSARLPRRHRGVHPERLRDDVRNTISALALYVHNEAGRTDTAKATDLYREAGDELGLSAAGLDLAVDHRPICDP
ncbi:MAG: hypothetical protein R2697_08735 [Ilumatobacteraceae bacterium]